MPNLCLFHFFLVSKLHQFCIDVKIKYMLFLYLLQQNVFPDRGTVYDFYFVKQASGSWNNWIERVDKSKNVIPKDAKVQWSSNWNLGT